MAGKIKFEFPKEFFDFKCSMCGECCSETPIVTMYDLEKFDNLSDFEVLLDIKVNYPVLLNDELIFIEEKADIIISPIKKDDKCVFFADGKCSVYPKKPAECLLCPFSIFIRREKGNFTATAFLSSVCSGVGENFSKNEELKKLLEKHFAELVRHEYFILNYSGKKNLDSIMEEWKLKKNMIEKKDLYKMLYEIYIKRKKEKSKLIIKNCF